MLRTMLKSKIQKLTVTATELYYEGSITIDAFLLNAADIYAGEKVEVLNLNNGSRIETYAISGSKGSGVVCLNGPSARFACKGDQVIVLAYAFVKDEEAVKLKAKMVYVNDANRLKT